MMPSANAPSRQMPTPQEVEQYKSDMSSLAQMKADERFYFPDGKRSSENDALWTKLHDERQARVDAYEEKHLPRRPSPRLQKEGEGQGAECAPASNLHCLFNLLSPQQRAATRQSQLVDQAVPLPKPLSQLIPELQESAFSSRSTEPPRPNLAPRNPDLVFWRDVIDYNVLSDQSSGNTAARAAAAARVKDWVGKLQDVGASLKTWGRWAAAELGNVTRLVDAVNERWVIVKLKAARAEELFRLTTDAKASMDKAMQSLNGCVERLVNGKTLSPELPAEVRTALKTIKDEVDTAEMCETALSLSVANDELDAALSVKKSMAEQRHDLWTTDGPYLGYHAGMVLAASGVQNPTYTQPFGWQNADGSFVQNPHHPYWCGRKLARYLRESGGLTNPDSLWFKADESEPSLDGFSLKHPLRVRDNRSYWAGIRHELEEVKTSYNNIPWAQLPKPMAEYVLARQI